MDDLSDEELQRLKKDEETKLILNDLSEFEEVQISEDVDGIDKKRKITEFDVATLCVSDEPVVSSDEPKRRKSVSKKDYSDEDLAAAIADIRNGSSLLEAAAKNHIPRSTLYMRAKIFNIPLNPSRSEYTNDDMKAAIQDVLGKNLAFHTFKC